MFVGQAGSNRSVRRVVTLSYAAVVSVLALVVQGCNDGASQPSDAQPAIEDSLARIMHTGVMHVGYIPYPPAVIKNDKTGALSGDFVAIARYIAAELGVKLEFHEATWSTFIAGLQNRQYDISIACTYIKVGRAQSVAYSRRSLILAIAPAYVPMIPDSTRLQM